MTGAFYLPYDRAYDWLFFALFDGMDDSRRRPFIAQKMEKRSCLFHSGDGLVFLWIGYGRQIVWFDARIFWVS